MSGEIAVSMVDVSKSFFLFNSPLDRMKEALSPFKRSYHTEFWALNDINLEITKGTTLGIMGENGAGKSTLLHLISRIQQPTTGSIQVEGRISTLELGVGFNPEFTGRENLIVHGQTLGRTKEEIKNRIPEIESFAEIGEFINYPLKTYSTGMYLRLSFAAAIDMDPDVLIIDEAMAVGDAMFQRKCYRKFEDFQAAGKTIILVSHSSEAIVNHCNSAALLDGGRLVMQDSPGEVANEYRALSLGRVEMRATENVGNGAPLSSDCGDRKKEFLTNRSLNDNCDTRQNYNKGERRLGQGGAEIIDYLLVAGDQIDPHQVAHGAKLEILVKVRFDEDVEAPEIGCRINAVDGIFLYGCSTRLLDQMLDPANAGDLRTYLIEFDCPLRPGDYFVSLGVGNIAGGNHNILNTRSDLFHLVVVSDRHTFDGLTNLNMRLKALS
jgi:lipopolysaccharide transport system ATP-binding protein